MSIMPIDCTIVNAFHGFLCHQLDIVEKCLFDNTLVSLPTGLGKTFIAAVVMYNFYRWYPQVRNVFER